MSWEWNVGKKDVKDENQRNELKDKIDVEDDDDE